MAKKYFYKGFYFDSEEEMQSAKKENEAIEFIKAKTDLENPEMVVALYNRLIDRKIITTSVGLKFLTELRAKILKTEIVDEGAIRPLPEIEEKRKAVAKAVLTPVQKLKKENVTLRIVVAGLLVIIVGMFVIVLTGKSSPLKPVYEESVLDKYAAWETELTKKTKWVNDRMWFLEQNGIYYTDETEE